MGSKQLNLPFGVLRLEFSHSPAPAVGESLSPISEHQKWIPNQIALDNYRLQDGGRFKVGTSKGLKLAQPAIPPGQLVNPPWA